MREDNRNLLVAIVLSVAVLLGWNYFFGVPQADRQQHAQQTGQPANPAAPNAPPSPSQAGGPSAPVPGTVPGQGPAAPLVESREAALRRTPRVAIDTPSVAGSINLRGGRIDDVSLRNYRETVDPRSANIVLFSPSGSQNPYYAEFGWVGAQAGALPGPDTVWTADNQVLTPGRPVTLSFDNGQGLVFRRTITVDDRSMFSVKDAVENAAPRR
jgi:YidC/Oxa1 family membrane protein insertase